MHTLLKSKAQLECTYALSVGNRGELTAEDVMKRPLLMMSQKRELKKVIGESSDLQQHHRHHPTTIIILSSKVLRVYTDPDAGTVLKSDVVSSTLVLITAIP